MTIVAQILASIAAVVLGVFAFADLMNIRPTSKGAFAGLAFSLIELAVAALLVFGALRL